MSSKIEWTGHTWNPIVGCRRVSAGCENCYAERTVHRGMSPQHKGLTVLGKKGPRWNGEYNVAEKRFDEPLRRKKATTWFVNSLSDLFFEPLPNELIAAIFGVMAATPQHTYQVLTKRPERAREWFAWLATDCHHRPKMSQPGRCFGYLSSRVDIDRVEVGHDWPLPNVQLGVSVEDQATADERIPVLLELPAALRWVSYEPALGPVDFDGWVPNRPTRDGPSNVGAVLDWIVIGGESGPGARPFDLAWARSTIEAGRAWGVPVFVKQFGRRPYQRVRGGFLDPEGEPSSFGLRDQKGGDMIEWPEDLRVREMPR